MVYLQVFKERDLCESEWIVLRPCLVNHISFEDFLHDKYGLGNVVDRDYLDVNISFEIKKKRQN